MPRTPSKLADRAYEAIVRNDLAQFTSLLAGLSDINSLQPQGRSLLAWACCFNRDVIALWLLQRGADPNHRDDIGWTPLKHVVHHNNADMIRALSIHGANLRARCQAGKNLLWSAWINQCEDAFLTLAALGLRARESGVPIADYRYLVNGGSMRGPVRHLTSPPLPLYAPSGPRDWTHVARALIAHYSIPAVKAIECWSTVVARLQPKFFRAANHPKA